MAERVDAMEATLAHIVPEFTSNLLAPVCLFILLFTTDWRMALAALTVVPVGMFCFAGMFAGYKENYERTINATKNLNTLTTQSGETRALVEAKEMERPVQMIMQPDGYDIHLDNVRFGYQEKEVLHGVTMSINAEEYIALVGPSGSGKSTIGRLIASLWDVNKGRITIGGVEIREIPLDRYNEYIAYVSQDNYLFNQTIYENIRIGKTIGETATDAEVEEVARRSGCYDFIMSLENGFDTIAGSAGGHLSGDERQRIAIARAMLKNAPIVILDEATANVDPESEAELVAAIEELTKEKTIIMIAHRLKTVRNADQIIVIDKGQIVQKGTHDMLINQDGIYQNFVAEREAANSWRISTAQ